MKRKRTPFAFDENVEYVVEDGLQRVKEYDCEFRSFAKARWVGMRIVDFFVSEFALKDRAYYEQAIERGMITVNDNPVTCDYIIGSNDAINHRVRRSEPAVLAQPLQVIHEDDELLVINKPSSLPVHPTGKYRYNTLTCMLFKDYGPTHPIHRLDRLTSGVLLFAKSANVSRVYGEYFKQNLIRKVYVAKVKGHFPHERITVSEPLLNVSPQSTLNIVHPRGKESETEIEFISFDGTHSLVKCMPKTGRTHQIRVHLRWLGFPIANDPIYTNETLWSGLDDYVADIETMMERSRKYLENDANPSKYLILWLHAHRVSINGKEFEAELPDWAVSAADEKGN